MENIIPEYIGVEALDFAEKELTKIKSNPDTWEIEYICDKTGDIWIMDYPNSELHGGGSPRLRRVKTHSGT